VRIVDDHLSDGPLGMGCSYHYEDENGKEVSLYKFFWVGAAREDGEGARSKTI